MILDDLIENVVERHVVGLNGTFTISLVDGGVRVRGQILSVLRDQRKNKAKLNVNIPVGAEVRIGTIVIPLPPIK
jgi:hypothetical protein